LDAGTVTLDAALERLANPNPAAPRRPSSRFARALGLAGLLGGDDNKQVILSINVHSFCWLFGWLLLARIVFLICLSLAPWVAVDNHLFPRLG